MNISNLILNLQKASEYFKSLGEATDLYYDETGYEFGQLVEKLKSKIENDTITDTELKELWFIFAPTCAWDDFRGDCDLGDEIFEALEISFKERIKSVMNDSNGKHQASD